MITTKFYTHYWIIIITTFRCNKWRHCWNAWTNNQTVLTSCKQIIEVGLKFNFTNMLSLIIYFHRLFTLSTIEKLYFSSRVFRDRFQTNTILVNGIFILKIYKLTKFIDKTECFLISWTWKRSHLFQNFWCTIHLIDLY